MRRNRRGSGFHQEFGGSGEDSFVAVVVTKLTGALLFILLLTMAIMALIPKADEMATPKSPASAKSAGLVLNLPEKMPEAIDGRAYQYAFSVRSDSSAPLVWSMEGELPKGLTFDSKSGVISGQATIEKTTTSELQVQVSDGSVVATGVTQLAVWKPDTTFSQEPAETISAPQFETTLQNLIGNGFGFALIWLGHFSGLGLVDRIESKQKSDRLQSDTNGNRFRGYRYCIWSLTIACSGFITWLLVV